MKKNYFIKNAKKSFIALTTIFCFLLANTAEAQKNIGWTGTTNNNWSTASNWKYSGVSIMGAFPTSSATVTLATANSDMTVGDKVSGYGIPLNAVITAIDATKKILTISPNTIAAAGTVTSGAYVVGTNVSITFATPKATSTPPTFDDIAVISNGGNPTLSPGVYSVAGVTVSNLKGAITGSTLTIGAGVEFNVSSTSNETVLLKGGNIVNNGILNVTCGYSGGTNNVTSGYAITCALPEVVPTVLTEYTYSGSGSLTIDTSSANNFSGGFIFNGADANAANATYKILFNGITDFLLSSMKSTTGTASTHLMRAVGISSLQACKVIIGGAGFNIGNEFSGAINGFLATSGGGVDVTIAQGTTINIFSDSNNPMPLMSMYAFGAPPVIPAFITNKGTINMKGSLVRSPISLSSQNNGTVNVVNDGIIDIDANSTSPSQAGIVVTNNGGATLPCDVIVTNRGTLSIKTLLNVGSWGAPISVSTFAGTPNVHVDNSGTLNLTGSNYSYGSKLYNPINAATQVGTSRITNSGTINTNQELRAFYTINTSTGKITFTGTPQTLKLATITVAATVTASIGATYTDANLNVHTVAYNKPNTGTALYTYVAAKAVVPGVSTLLPTPTLTLTSGTGDATIAYTAQVSNNNSALYSATLNSGTINTNTGTTAMTNVTGVKTEAATSVFSPGGDSGKGIAVFGKELESLIVQGTLKIQVSGNTAAGVDYDQMNSTGLGAGFDVTAATLDVTGIYKPTTAVTIDIMTTNTAVDTGGAAVGPFASVMGLTLGWSVNFTGGIGGKVQLVFNPNLSTSYPEFSNFKFSYYPNPAKNQVNVSAEKNISKVELFNFLGQKVLSNTENAMQKQINITHLQKGIYLMEVSIDNAKKTFKIIKE